MTHPVRAWVDRWVRFWDHREPPHVLAAIRVLLGLAILGDLFVVAWHDLVVPLMAARGVEASVATGPLPRQWHWLWSVLPPTEAGAWMLWLALVSCAAAFTVGALTPASGLLLVLLWAQWEMNTPTVDRAVDRICRNVLLILVCSGCGRAFSVDARLRTGTWRGEALVGAWGRYLIIAQIVVMYVTAGLFKTGFLWTPWGEYGALYVLLQDPTIQRFDFAWLADQPWYLLTQASTAITVYWQWSYALVPLFLYWRSTPERGGWARRWSNRLHLDAVWVGIGAWFHIALFITCELGLFPFAMLAMYPCFVDPARCTGLRRSE